MGIVVWLGRGCYFRTDGGVISDGWRSYFSWEGEILGWEGEAVVKEEERGEAMRTFAREVGWRARTSRLRHRTRREF